MTRTAALACGLGIVSGSLAPGLAMACVAPLARSASEQAAADLTEQSSAWRDATTVYFADIVEYRPEPSDIALEPSLPGTPRHRVVLRALSVLKGSAVPETVAISLALRLSCVPSDIERGELGDRFVIFAGPDGPSSRSGIVSIESIRLPEILAALDEELVTSYCMQ